MHSTTGLRRRAGLSSARGWGSTFFFRTLNRPAETVNFCRREHRRRRGRGRRLNVDKRRFFPPRTTINNTRAPNVRKNRTNTSRLPNARRVRATKTISHGRTTAISGPARLSADPHVRPRSGSGGGAVEKRGGDLLFVARLPCFPPAPLRGVRFGKTAIEPFFQVETRSKYLNYPVRVMRIARKQVRTLDRLDGFKRIRRKILCMARNGNRGRRVPPVAPVPTR